MALPQLPSSSSLSSVLIHAPSSPPHVSYVLLAEFDIDEGSVLRHQYPAPTGTDEHLLAEHMLPDGAHDRNEDWTIFYLNQIPGLTVDPSLASAGAVAPERDGSDGRGAKGKGRAVQGDLRTADQGDGLLYVMSLVRTKKDASVRRGALVKALAVATHNPYIQIYKPILLLALDDYYNEPSVACLSRLYSAINAMETVNLPRLSRDERLILRTSERKDIFAEKFVEGDATSYLHRTPSTPSLSQTLHISDDGAEVLDGLDHRSVSSGSIESLKEDSMTPSTIDDFGLWRGRSRAGTINSSEDVQSSLPSYFVSKGDGDRSGTSFVPNRGPKDTHWFDTRILYNGIPLPIRVPLATFPDEVGDYSLIKLVQTFSTPAGTLTSGPIHPHLHTNGPSTHPIILLFNALVTHKRVVFLGHGHPAGAVANLVLAACALGTGCGAVLQGFTERAFPYTNLSNLDNLQTVPGYIAGVCNPAFADRPGWWDVLCNIETGKIVVSKDIRPVSVSSRYAPSSLRSDGPPSSFGDDLDIGKALNAAVGVAGSVPTKMDSKADSYDQSFMEEITSTIQAHYGEAVIRARFTDYVQRFVRLASRYTEETLAFTSIGYACFPFASGAGPGQPAQLGSGISFPDDATRMRELATNAGRIEGWIGTPSYVLYQQSFREQQLHSPLRDLDLSHQLMRLRQGKRVPSAEVELILKTISQQTRTEDQVMAVLAHLPPHHGGLLPLAMGLFHPSEQARNDTVDLLDSLGMNPTGLKFIQSLNAFPQRAYLRLAQGRSLDKTPSPHQPKTFGAFFPGT